jgi:VanZ family protein
MLTALAILYLSLANSSTFEKVPLINIPYIDKVVHFLMYFGLMSVIMLEHKDSVKNNAALLRYALIPVAYGILMEILQLFTVSRSGNVADAFADFAGIGFSILLWLLMKPLLYRRSDNY